jgi:hypothetical protein
MRTNASKTVKKSRKILHEHQAEIADETSKSLILDDVLASYTEIVLFAKPSSSSQGHHS